MIVFIGLFAASFTMLNCTKDKSQNESIFYGTWVKGTNTGDTLQFYQKNGKNILALNYSFNSLIYAPTEFEYFYVNDHLSIRHTSTDFSIESFTWKQVGQEFELQGTELFPFMSSTQVYFNYRKIR